LGESVQVADQAQHLQIDSTMARRRCECALLLMFCVVYSESLFVLWSSYQIFSNMSRNFCYNNILDFIIISSVL
jgi:hypothetical protein